MFSLKSSLNDQLSSLINPEPVFLEPEDQLEDETYSKTCLIDNKIDSPPIIETSKLRKAAGVLLEDFDSKYAGKKVSRKSLNETQYSDDEPIENESENESQQNSYSDAVSDTEYVDSDNTDSNAGSDESDSMTEDDDYDDENDSENSDNESRDEFGDEFDDESGHTAVSDNATDQDTIKSFSSVDLESDLQKAVSSKAQLGLWDNMIELRIKLQKSLGLVNQLPRPSEKNELAQPNHDELANYYSQVEQQLVHLLSDLIELQAELLQQNDETKHCAFSHSKLKPSVDVQLGSDGDEEFKSESENELKSVDLSDIQSSTSILEPEDKGRGNKRSLEFEECSESLKKHHLSFHQFRNDTIQKWSNKTKIASSKPGKSFSDFDISTLKQIDQILADEKRLIQRTQINRSNIKVIGQSKEEDSAPTPIEENEQDVKLIEKGQVKELDPELFDDSDFYHSLLKEIIEKKTVDVNDPSALTRQWLQVERLRKKVKRTIDTKASKGRKIRYNIQTKLVNFMAPIIEPNAWSDKARNDLFKCLFGKIQTKNDTD